MVFVEISMITKKMILLHQKPILVLPQKYLVTVGKWKIHAQIQYDTNIHVFSINTEHPGHTFNVVL